MRARIPRPTWLEITAMVLCATIAASYVAPQQFRIVRDKPATARSDIGGIRSALETYSYDTGEFPSTTQTPAALLQKPATKAPRWWFGPYVIGALPTDPWGRPYVYRSDSTRTGYTIATYGADGRPGGERLDADIVARQ